MSKKFIFVNTDGDYEETPGAYEQSDFIDSTTGVGDAGKPIILDSTGKLDGSFFDFGDIDHGGLSGLGDDDHTQYILVDGTRAFTGDVSLGGFNISNLAGAVSGTDAVNLDQLNAAVKGLQDFRESVKDRDLLTPPTTPVEGDRYLIGQPTDTATGDWAGHAGEITEYTGGAWTFEDQPDHGTLVFVEDAEISYVFNSNTFASGVWVAWNSGLYTASLGVQLVGNDMRADFDSTLALTGNSLGIDWSTTFDDDKAIKAADLASVANGFGASIIGVEDAAGYFTATDVEAALQELYETTGKLEEKYTVDSGPVNFGDLVHVTANNSVSTLNVSTSGTAVGLANETKATGEIVGVQANSAVLEGVLSGATAGDRYYWNGSAHSSSIPNGGGAYVWQTGIAKNATDLIISLRFLKKNA